MKKKIIIGVISVFTLLLVSFTVYYFVSITAVDKNNTKEIVFNINPGTSKVDIAKNLKSAGVIRSDKTAMIYMFFNSDLSLQAGEYSLNKTMNLKEILTKFNKGDIKVDTKTITFVEGKRLKEYIGLLTKEYNFTEEEIIDVINDKIYYGLEGYILPDTYEFLSSDSIKDIFVRLLDYTDKKLSPFKEQIEKSKHSVHEILTMASIIELEANSASDRKTVSQVIYKRLDYNMSLGMDVTTYYATQKQMGETLTFKDLMSGNAYNTRNVNMIGLPVGPICNPSNISIDAVFNPSDTDYLYFYADVKTGLVYFAKTDAEFNQIIKEVG